MNHQTPELSEQLRVLVSREHAMLRQLQDTMARERDLLLAGGELDAVLQEKQGLFQQLEAATRIRLEWLRREGIPCDHGDMREHAISLDRDGTLLEELRAFEATAAQCRQTNLSLSPIIRRRRDFLNRAAASLGLGPDASEASYTPGGQALAETGNRHLGSA